MLMHACEHACVDAVCVPVHVCARNPKPCMKLVGKNPSSGVVLPDPKFSQHIQQKPTTKANNIYRFATEDKDQPQAQEGSGHAYLFYLHIPKGKYVDCIVRSLNSTQQFDRHAAVNLQSIIGPVPVSYTHLTLPTKVNV